MAISMRDLFSRQNLPNEVISLGISLAKHDGGTRTTLRQAATRFLQPANGDGWARGCHRPTQAIAGELSYVVPSWVPVHDRDVRTVEGVLTKSSISRTDFPLKPWHTYYDWNFFIRLDKQYTYLHSNSNIQDHGNLMECEWDTAFLPQWAWPPDGARIWMVGRWIYDCGHPERHGHKTEIHPPKAISWFGTGAVRLPGNADVTRATRATLYIGRHGGYWTQAVNDQDYTFDLYLPPKPYAEATPAWLVDARTPLSVWPQITPLPAASPRYLRVTIPLRGVNPQPDQYGAVIWGGWTDPRRTESAAIQRLRVRLTTIYMDGDYDTFGDEWHVYAGINGSWNVWKSIGGSSKSVTFSVDLDLHTSDRVHVTGCGFEADLMDDYMADESGYTWAQISNPNITREQREAIEDSVFWQLAGTLNDENDAIGYLSDFHPATARGTFISGSDKGDYRFHYKIENR
jgi:hypothetical protein